MTKIDELIEATRNIKPGIIEEQRRKMELTNFIIHYQQTRMKYWGDFVDVYNGAAS